MRKNYDLVCYLAGKMSGLSIEKMNTWRVNITFELLNVAENSEANIKVINPVNYFNFTEKRYKSEREVMKFDLAKVRSSDIIIVNLDGLNTSIGSCIECYEAYKLGIPVLAFGDSKLYEELHPWIQNCITRTDSTYMETVNYIRDFYMM